MIKIGLIGCGKWGKVLHGKLKEIADVVFVCRSRENYLLQVSKVDWVIVATPNDTHYDIVYNCLKSNKNVFCEKPLSLTYKQSKILYDLSNKMKLRLYVDDIQNYIKVKYDFKKSNFIERNKNCVPRTHYTSKDLLYRLTYHDLYFIYRHIKDLKISDIVAIELKNKLHFKILFNDVEVEFLYSIECREKFSHSINSISLINNDSNYDPLHNMLQDVFKEKADFKHNMKISLFANQIIDLLHEKL